MELLYNLFLLVAFSVGATIALAILGGILWYAILAFYWLIDDLPEREHNQVLAIRAAEHAAEYARLQDECQRFCKAADVNRVFEKLRNYNSATVQLDHEGTPVRVTIDQGEVAIDVGAQGSKSESSFQLAHSRSYSGHFETGDVPFTAFFMHREILPSRLPAVCGMSAAQCNELLAVVYRHMTSFENERRASGEFDAPRYITPAAAQQRDEAIQQVRATFNWMPGRDGVFIHQLKPQPVYYGDY